MRAFEPMLVPGLFQTEDYARAILETNPEATEEKLGVWVDGRMARQAILDRKEPAPPWMWVVLDEQVLHRNIGGPSVMIAQLERLAQLSTKQRISIQVIPADGPHPGLLGAFWLAELEQPPAVVYLETASEGETIETHYMAKSMTVLFDALRAEALTRSASLALIEEAALRWKEKSET